MKTFWQYVFKHWNFRNVILPTNLVYITLVLVLLARGELTKSMYSLGFWFLLGIITVEVSSQCWNQIKDDYRRYKRNYRRNKLNARSLRDDKAS